MARIERIKKRLVIGAVHENVDLIQGRLPKGLDRRSSVWRTLARTGPLVLGAVAVLIGSLVVAQVSRQLPVTVPVPVESVSGAPLVEVSRFDAPASIDPRVFPLGVRRVVLDPGHGGSRAGTVGEGLRESEITLDIARRTSELLAAEGLEVLMTREQDEHVELDDRVAFANQSKGDVFVSIHVNWLETRAVRGIETYYLGPTEDPYLTQLTSTENLDSGYSLTDFRRLLDGLYGDVRQDESRDLASQVQRSMYRSLLRVSPTIQNRGVKTAPFVVLIGTEMPAILAEVSCLSNREEAELLKKPLYRQYLAEALSRGILDYSQSLNGPNGRPLDARPSKDSALASAGIGS